MVGHDQDQDQDKVLAARIRSGWQRGNPALGVAAEQDVAEAVPLRRWVHASHGADRDEDRWTYLRHYLAAYSTVWGTGPLSEDHLLDEVVRQEKLYLTGRERRAAAAERALRPGAQREALQAWARRQPMNPADNFEPGIAFYDLSTAASKPDWVDRDIADIEQDGYVTTISYSRGRALSFPAKSLDFTGQYESAVVEMFARRHRVSGRLIPFVIYRGDAGPGARRPEVDALSSEDRVLMAVPYMLTPAVAAFYSQDPLLQVAGGLLNVLKLMSLQKGLPLGTPVSAGTVRLATDVGVRGIALARGAAAEMTFAVRTYGFSTQAAAYVGRSAYTYYLTNAVALNTQAIVGADIALSLSGQDMGPISPADSITMAVHTDDAVKAGSKTLKSVAAELKIGEDAAQTAVTAVRAGDAAEASTRTWKAVTAEVEAVDQATRTAKLKVTKVEQITDDVAKAEYDAGTKVIGQTRGASRAARGTDDALKVRPPVVPLGKVAKGTGKLPDAAIRRFVAPIGELEDAMKKVTSGLPKLAGKFSPGALAKLSNLSADTIRESGIRPADLAKLANSLSRSGPTTRKFIEDFHDVPGFEQVILNWAKRHYWNTRLKKPAWSETKAFYTGTSFLMKYSVRRLDPRVVRFEWPVSINTARSGEEVTARFVDIVLSGGTTARPGDRISIELKSWTEFVLRSKTSFATGQAVTRPGSVGYQLVRDTALFGPNNVRWVFDRKVGFGDVNRARRSVVAAFERVIMGDEYLRLLWATDHTTKPHRVDRAKLRELLDQVIEIF